jgi:hypothetical protein
MPRTLSPTVIEAMNAQSTGVAVLALVTITHSTFTTVRVVNNTENVTSNGDLFTALPFTVRLPADSEEYRPVMKVGVPNVSLDLMTELRSVAGSREKIKVALSIVDHAAPDTLLAAWTDFEVENVNYTAESLTFDLTLKSYLAEPYPGGSFTPSDFPGLF